ncbi:hypothetical protein RAZWK3B_17753 [Roseobacter sp. AzwK-3b]|uniref:hypothetical protein n=1 Tax=Roseobacter sp. AzwK-3b TaxID=351016 RepID=UPI0001568C0C|nr:hypothetical protein [Roseobacter sp. AzwK-3b]EDM71987.1 hypothetical protein RAZWK3B_17753 [Roseobacter sp. AzwK-3b]
MVLITQDDRPTGLTTSIDSLERQLADMQVGLLKLYDRIQDGDLENLKNANRATAEIRQWLKIAIEAEVHLEKRRKHEKGIVNDYALDLSEARVAVCGRLDRLRRARCPGRVYRQSR